MASTAPTFDELARALKDHLPPGYGAVLFGSRATGGARASSDWDVGITGPAPLPGNLVEEVREALEALPTLHSFDVVDLATTSQAFRGLVLEHAVRIL